jgi:hypothetical protein
MRERTAQQHVEALLAPGIALQVGDDRFRRRLPPMRDHLRMKAPSSAKCQ